MKYQNIYNDKELFNRIAAGDEKAFRVFFDSYKDRFYAVVFKMTRSDNVAEEIVQELFLKIWQKRELLYTVSNIDSYLFTALYRLIFKQYKKMAIERNLNSIIYNSPTFKNVTDETIMARESNRLITEAISKLPQQQQIVFTLSRQEGYTREQIAEHLKISPHTAKNHLLSATKAIRQHLGYMALLYLITMLE